MNSEIIVGVTSAALTTVVGPIVMHYVKILTRKKEAKDPLEEAMKINSLITDKLDEIKDKTGTDRIWLMQFHNGGYFYPTGKSIQKFSMVYELLVPGTPSCQGQFQNIPVSLFSKTVNKLHSGEHIEIPDSKKNAENYGLGSISDISIKSSYLFPVTTLSGDFVGIIGLDYIAKQIKLSELDLAVAETEIASIGSFLGNYLKN